MSSRMKPPVFVVGCPRSGTSLLYHMLLSSGGFAVFRTEMNAFNLIGPIFGDLTREGNRRRLLSEWLSSKAFKVSGLDARDIESKVHAECRSAGDFLRIVMDEIARKQGVDRWADSTPANILHLREIKAELPEARFVHLVRDGRDVAVSLDKLGWTRPLPWERRESLTAGGLYWQWTVQTGRSMGAALGQDYMEVRFEELVERPEETLAALGEFLEHDLQYERIQQVAVGAVATPSSSFGDWGSRHSSRRESEDSPARPVRNGGQSAHQPVGRWKALGGTDLAKLEALIGETLEQCGYPLASSPHDRAAVSRLRLMRLRASYRTLFETKHWVKNHTGMLRWFVRYSDVLIDK